MSRSLDSSPSLSLPVRGCVRPRARRPEFAAGASEPSSSPPVRDAHKRAMHSLTVARPPLSASPPAASLGRHSSSHAAGPLPHSPRHPNSVGGTSSGFAAAHNTPRQPDLGAEPRVKPPSLDLQAASGMAAPRALEGEAPGFFHTETAGLHDSVNHRDPISLVYEGDDLFESEADAPRAGGFAYSGDAAEQLASARIAKVFDTRRLSRPATASLSRPATANSGSSRPPSGTRGIVSPGREGSAGSRPYTPLPAEGWPHKPASTRSQHECEAPRELQLTPVSFAHFAQMQAMSGLRRDGLADDELELEN